MIPTSTTAFHATRLSIRAVLISSLLILGHVLLSTAAVNPIAISNPLLAPALKCTSALIFLTLLWTSFTLLEEVDFHLVSFPPAPVLPRQAIERETHAVFGKTWIELVLNSVILGSWADWSGDAVLVIKTYSASLSSELAIVPVTYGLSLICITLLQAQLVLSISYHALIDGQQSLFSRSFWNSKTGHWTGRITLDEESIADDEEGSRRQEKWGRGL